MNTSDPREQLSGELHWLDLALLAEVIRLRRSRPRPADQFQGLYIADIDVDHLLAASLGGSADSTGTNAPVPDLSSDLLLRRLMQSADATRAELDARAAAGGTLLAPLDRMAADFGLSANDRGILLLTCAADLEPRFETLYAYVQDDVTRRRPTVGLALKLLCPESGERWRLRSRFEGGAPLVRHGLVRMTDEQPFLSRVLRADDRVVDELVGLTEQIDQRLAGFTEVRLQWSRPEHIPEAVTVEIPRWVRAWSAGGSPVVPLALCDGPDPRSAETVCGRIGEELGRPLLVVRLGALCDGQMSGDDAMRVLLREAVLRRALILFTDCDRLTEPDQRAVEIRRSLEPLLRQAPVPIAISGARSLSLSNLYTGLAAIRLDLPLPAYRERLDIWSSELAHGGAQQALDPTAVASKFLLSPRQIAAGAELAVQMARLRGDSGGPIAADLYAAARSQSHHGLAALARKIEPVYGWVDIVLSRATAVQLHEIASAVEHRQLVLADWGFGRYSRGRGLNVLFSGASGTGKTMAAEVLAMELGLDLYEIDLATIVSKYIGETEKNLKRIFGEAQSSNAILFFDEADALFGKRSEVRDAHDRYANLEIAYLLQLMEEYEGMAILATNLSRNVDEAFARRMQYLVEFPIPDRVLRSEIWRKAFPQPTPMGDVDLSFMAEHFELAGGGIRGAALGAATLAAADGGQVEMKHLALAVAREYQKLGKLPSQSEFGPYYTDVLRELRVG